jgi:serine/threonine protein kinase
MPKGRGGKVVGKAAGRVAVRPLLPLFPLLPPLTKSEIPSAVVSSLPEFSTLQPFFATQERFQSEPIDPDRCWMGAAISSLTRTTEQSLFATARVGEKEVPVFLKRIHLLDPLRAVEGEYRWKSDGILSAPVEIAERTYKKIQDPLNEAYVDALFALCANQFITNDLSPHWCQCFGTMSGRVHKYLYNITDEVDEFERSSWWASNQRKGLFRVIREGEEEELLTGSSAVQGVKQILSDAQSLSGDEFEEMNEVSFTNSPSPVLYSSLEEPVTSSEAAVALSAPRVRLKRINDESSNSSTTNDSDGPQTFAEFSEFPVQVSLLERADGTMDDLLEEEEEDSTKEERWSAWIFQVIAALTCAQTNFGFIHNDLHTNNIMWSATTQSHILYKIHKRDDSVFYMKVPTFGKIMKIIDFGRASFTLPPEQGGFYISDAFFEGNDAADQYNCAPFYNSSNGPKVEPNPSFDLCRLSVSLIESLYGTRPDPVHPVRVMSKEGAKIYTETKSPLYNLLWSWLLDMKGWNVLRTPDGRERYPDFDLYKAIGRDVKGAVPSRQLESTTFASFRMEGVPPPGFKVYDLYM